MTEAEFQAQVVALAQLFGWQAMHVRRSVVRDGQWATATSVVGWPDLTLWRPGELLFAELKSDRGRLSPEQESVVASLREAGQEVVVWRPRDWLLVERRLRPTPRPAGVRSPARSEAGA